MAGECFTAPCPSHSQWLPQQDHSHTVILCSVYSTRTGQPGGAAELSALACSCTHWLRKLALNSRLHILALPGPNSTNVLGPGKRACKVASGSLWPGFASTNQLSVWNASPQLLIHDYLPFSSSVILKGRVQNLRSWHSWRSQVKSTNQITRNQGSTCHTRGHHNQASRIFNMIGWW